MLSLMLGSRSKLCHPCDWINKFLLDQVGGNVGWGPNKGLTLCAQTGADVAISHDDDWRFYLEKRKDVTWNGTATMLMRLPVC